MREKLAYFRTALISITLGLLVGILFPETKYFAIREDGIAIEITKTRYKNIIEVASNTKDVTIEESFHIWFFVIAFFIVFVCGLFLLQYRGPNVKRNVRQSLYYPKSTQENIQENLHGDSNFMP